ncbi:MAG TPA: hypothetical protein VF173_32565 [Thermoanaerobaculia bacterium]|nr:hypothetical protein [Thermoanaerobaculia bacterium]
MKRTAFWLLVLPFLLGFASPSRADVCSSDVKPAATLLLPYFEVDLQHAHGTDTVFSINNAFSAAQLAHVVVWSDLGAAVLDFNVYLTGYDMEVISLRDIIVNGLLPQTASAGQDPADTISPQGSLSQDVNFASCTGQLPPPAGLPAVFITHLQNSLTGQGSVLFGGLCAGRNLGDNVARGFVTVDVVKSCTLRFPSDTGYFGPGGDASDDNVLFGDYAYVDASQGKSVGNTLVHVEASATSPETSTPGQYTFYGRFVGWSALDHRSPLPTTFGALYRKGDTDLVVWRDPKVVQNAFTCPAAAGNPAWYPLGQEAIVTFDQRETAATPPASAKPFPAAAQRTRVGGGGLPTPFASGWAYLNLNTTVPAAGANPPEDPAADQAWVSVVTADGRSLVGFDAMRYDSACQAKHTNPPN